MLPTPTGDDANNVTRASGSWTTPQSQDAKHSGHGASDKNRDLLSVEVAGQGIGGSLSPDWVSWLMGLPVGWTSLEPMPRREYLSWLHAQLDGTWWDEERGLPRVSTGVKDRVNRLKALGNGIVPASLCWSRYRGVGLNRV